MRIATLLTDNEADSEFALRYPHDGEKFRMLMQQHRPDWSFDTIRVKDGIFPDDPSAYDGFVVAGSPASANDEFEWIARLKELIRELHQRKIPTMGACFGHQAIASALGGKVGKNPNGWNLGATEIRFEEHRPWMEPAHPKLRIHSAHNEQVLEPPAGAQILATDPVNRFSALSIGDHVFSIQHHPELSRDFMDGLLVELLGKVDDETLERAGKALEAGAEGARFAEWMVRFFEFGNRGRPAT